MIENKINAFRSLLKSYILLLLGLLCLSLILYFKFIRERIPKDIPLVMTEYRFWFLLYICLLYLYIVITLLRSNTSSLLMKEIIRILFIPLVTLDNSIKYNRFFKQKYYKIMTRIINYLTGLDKRVLIAITFLFQIFPRIILVTALVIDTFYFCKLEILYKFMLIGIIPFIHKYIKYCLKEIVDEYIKDLLTLYRDEIGMTDKAYANPNIKWEKGEHNKYHDEDITIKEYIEFRTQQLVYKTPDVDYMDSPMLLDKFFDEYAQTKYRNKDAKLTKEDYKVTDNIYRITKEKILQYTVFTEKYNHLDNNILIKWFRISIFTLYFLTWSFILLISYYFCPVNLIMGKYFIYNLVGYLHRLDDIFSGLDQGPKQRNLITIDTIKVIYNIIKNKFKHED